MPHYEEAKKAADEMRVNHTPAPWILDESQIDKAYCYYVVATDHDGTQIVIAETEGDSDTEEANACLIAAAPELLEALEELSKLDVKGFPLIQRLQFTTGDRILAEKITSAIAKARGGAQ